MDYLHIASLDKSLTVLTTYWIQFMMFQATNADKKLVTKILTNAFYDNKSFNAIIPQGKRKRQRIEKIFNYYFDIFYETGRIYLSADYRGCAIVSLPDQRKTTLKTLLMDVGLLFTLGLNNALKGFRREKTVNRQRPKVRMYYLLFIGVEPDAQDQGIGSQLMRELIEDSQRLNRPFYLETHLEKNLQFYKKFGLEIFHEMNLGFPLYFLRRDLYLH